MKLRQAKITIWVLILAVAPLLASNFWEEKDYTKWSEKDCMKMLRKSP